MTFGMEEYRRLRPHLTQLGFSFKTRSSKHRTDRGGGGGHDYRIFVTEDQQKAAALFFRNYFGIDDPETADPFTGNCPACGIQVFRAWECPSCEIDFRGGFDEDHPLVLFIRRHGGFEDG